MTRPKSQVHAILSFTVDAFEDQERASLPELLATLLEAHPASRIEVTAGEKGLTVGGEDELELSEIRQEILRHFNTVVCGELKINYKESIRKPAEAEGKYVRQTGGSPNYGHCWIRLEPGPAGSGYQFIADFKDGRLPEAFVNAIARGVASAMKQGILAGYPLVDIKVTLFDGSWHEADSNEMAFRFAGSIAFKEAARKASPVLLEPVMSVEATVPEEFMGLTLAEINERRGRIEGMEHRMEHRTGSISFQAIVPLAETLRSSPRGRLVYPMQFARYEPAPSHRGDMGDDAGSPARMPGGPKPRTGSAAADLDP